MASPATPFIHYYCACPDFFGSSASPNQDLGRSPDSTLKKDAHVKASISTGTSNSGHLKDKAADSAASTSGDHLLSAQAANYLYPLSRLYFCEDCHQIRCPSCVQDEIVSYYCPNCLFEVPTASVKSEKNRCARNCFQCPICENTLSVVATHEPTSASAPASGGPYFLACNVCRWNSKEIGMTFEKPTSLALQLQKANEALPDAIEFDNLKEHLEKHLRLNAPPSLPSFLSFSSAGFSKIIGNHFNTETQMQDKPDDLGAYKPAVQVQDEDLKTVDRLITLRSVEQVSSLQQRYTQLYDQPYELNKIHPQRIHLCIKRSKRCRTCRHILIKPEQKAQATRFKIKLVAMNYIPNISIVKLPRKSWPLRLGIPTQFVLKFTNPLYEEMSITLATIQMRKKQGSIQPAESSAEDDARDKFRGKVTILSPHFTVGAYNETIEYDDELYPTGTGARGRGTHGGGGGVAGGGLSSSWTSGIYEKRNNYTSVIVEVIPEQPGEFKFPLLVTYTYKSDDDRMDVSSGDIDEEDIENMDDDGHKKANTSMRLDDDRTKSYSFWCLVGLGHVADEMDDTL